jgi:hypothetical protein
MDEKELNACNKEILMRLHEEGVALPSYTLLECPENGSLKNITRFPEKSNVCPSDNEPPVRLGRYAIRVAITNHRSRLEDFDALVDASVRIGRDIHITQ